MLGILDYVLNLISAAAIFGWMLKRMGYRGGFLIWVWQAAKYVPATCQVIYYLEAQHWYSRAFFILLFLYWFWQVHNDKDDWWKRQAEKAWGKVKDLGHRLVVVPAPARGAA